MAAPAPNLGGTGSPEHTAALTHNGGVARRNSISQANGIHAMVPSGGGPVTAAQLEGLRAGGRVTAAALSALIPPGTEQNWNPHFGGGRAQIRTGRNFDVPDAAGGQFRVRVHTNDNNRPLADNAGSNAVLRVEKGRQTLLSAPIAAHADARMIGRNWAGATAADPALINSAHIPLDAPAPAPAPAHGMLPPIVGRVARGIGTAVWHGSGASSIVGGTQQIMHNAQPGGTWSGMAMGAVRVAAGAAWMGALATTAPARAVAATAAAGLSAVGRTLTSGR